MDQAHHGGGTLARAQAAGEQPVVATNGNRPDLVFDSVVIGDTLHAWLLAQRQRVPDGSATAKAIAR